MAESAHNAVGLLRHFIPLVTSDSQKRQEAGLPSQPLFPLISLYNSVLGHLISQASSRELLNIQWPLPEFVSHLKFSSGVLPPLKWNSLPYLEEVAQCLSRLALPTHLCGDHSLTEVGWLEGFVGTLATVGDLEQSILPLLSWQVNFDFFFLIS